MNASANVSNFDIANKIASTASLFRIYFPEAKVDFSPKDSSSMDNLFDTLDFSFNFPGWKPSIECKAIDLQLRIDSCSEAKVPKLLGIVMKGNLLAKERWRFASIGEWEMTGKHLPEKIQKDNLLLVCKELYKLFSKTSSGNKK